MNRIAPIFENWMNEELVYSEGTHFHVYKNPKSIKRMTAWKRAISDKDGNLFVFDDENYGSIHYQSIRALEAAGIFTADTDFEDWMGKFIGWQQVGNTNIFCLAESYDHRQGGFSSDIKKFEFWKKIINKLSPKVKKAHPQFKFKTQIIWSYVERVESLSAMRSGRFELK